MQNTDPQELRRPPMPPRPPLFGIRIHPLVAVIIVLLLIGVAVLICFSANPNFMPNFNPFAVQFPPQ